MIFCEKDANLKIRPTSKQEENRNVNLPEMPSTGKQEENGNCGKYNSVMKVYDFLRKRSKSENPTYGKTRGK